MKYFQKQTLRFEKLRDIKDCEKRVTFSVMLYSRSLHKKKEAAEKGRSTGRCLVLFSWVNDIKILIPYDQISRMKYKQ